MFLIAGTDGGLSGCIARGMDAGKFRALTLRFGVGRALLQFFQRFKESGNIFLFHFAEDSKVRASFPLILVAKPDSDFVLDKELVCKVTLDVKEHEVVKSKREFFDSPVEFLSQINLLHTAVFLRIRPFSDIIKPS